MAGRNSSFNTRQLLNIIDSPNPVVPKVVISLDAEKAFDRVEWEYLHYVLWKFDSSSDIIAWIRLLYDSPTAHILTYSVRSLSFALHQTGMPRPPPSPICFSCQAVGQLASGGGESRGHHQELCHPQVVTARGWFSFIYVKLLFSDIVSLQTEW